MPLLANMVSNKIAAFGSTDPEKICSDVSVDGRPNRPTITFPFAMRVSDVDVFEGADFRFGQRNLPDNKSTFPSRSHVLRVDDECQRVGFE